VENDVTPTRRHVVTAGAATTLGIATAVLTGCGGSHSTTTGTSSPGSAGNSEGRPAGAWSTVQAPNAEGSPSAASGPLAKLAAVPVGGAIAAKGTDGTQIVIAQPQAGKVVAFSAVCTHMGCTVVPAGQKLLCPCHNSTFDPTTGAVTAGPAPTGLPAVTVKVDGDDIVPG
jgi:cytochrome b6-f complex iron-sulfur subunit